MPQDPDKFYNAVRSRPPQSPGYFQPDPVVPNANLAKMLRAIQQLYPDIATETERIDRPFSSGMIGEIAQYGDPYMLERPRPLDLLGVSHRSLEGPGKRWDIGIGEASGLQTLLHELLHTKQPRWRESVVGEVAAPEDEVIELVKRLINKPSR